MITQAELKQRVHYDPETGVFTWLQHRWVDKVGKRAESFEKDKSGFLWLDNKKHRTNRLAFLYMTGEIPVKVGFKDNNTENLRWGIWWKCRKVLRAIKQSDQAPIHLAIRVLAGAPMQKNGERCAAMEEIIIFSAIMRHRKQLNGLMTPLLQGCLGSFLILVKN